MVNSAEKEFGVRAGNRLIEVPRLILDIRVEYAFLLQVVRHGVLRQKRCLEPDFGADPFPLGVRSAGGVIAASAAAELRTEIGALNLIELSNLAPDLVADGAGDESRRGPSSAAIRHE